MFPQAPVSIRRTLCKTMNIPNFNTEYKLQVCSVLLCQALLALITPEEASDPQTCLSASCSWPCQRQTGSLTLFGLLSSGYLYSDQTFRKTLHSETVPYLITIQESSQTVLWGIDFAGPQKTVGGGSFCPWVKGKRSLLPGQNSLSFQHNEGKI